MPPSTKRTTPDPVTEPAGGEGPQVAGAASTPVSDTDVGPAGSEVAGPEGAGSPMTHAEKAALRRKLQDKFH